MKTYAIHRRTKRQNKTIKKRKPISKRQSRKKHSKKRQTGGNSTVKCCMCHQKIDKLSNAFIPLKCLNEHGAKAHRICPDCWWDPKKGFALENAEHKCPGCKTKFPLTVIKQQEEVIDLT